LIPAHITPTQMPETRGQPQVPPRPAQSGDTSVPYSATAAFSDAAMHKETCMVSEMIAGPLDVASQDILGMSDLLAQAHRAQMFLAVATRQCMRDAPHVFRNMKLYSPAPARVNFTTVRF
jgi:hypothetical protein